MVEASVSVSESVSEVRECDGTGKGEKPSGSLTERLRGVSGVRKGELVVFVASEGVGKMRVEKSFLIND